MSDWLGSVRVCLWSDLCLTDPVAYDNYLSTVKQVVKDGYGSVAACGGHGSGSLSERCGGRFDDDLGAFVTNNSGSCFKEITVVGGAGVAATDVDAQNNGDSRYSSGRVGVCNCGLSGRSSGCGVCGLLGVGGSTPVCRPAREQQENTKLDAGPVGSQASVLVGPNHAKNVEKKKRQKANRLKTREIEFVPEWRRKAGNGFHSGVFSECSVEVKRELRDSRALMLVKQNELAVAKAEVERRRAEALLKSQVIERDVENKRLKLDSEFSAAMIEKKKAIGPGFAETLVTEGLESICSVPSLSSGSVSPNSSISVAELNRLVASLSSMAEDRFELRRSVLAKDDELAELKRKLESLTTDRRSGDVNKNCVDHVRIHGGNGFSSWSY